MTRSSLERPVIALLIIFNHACAATAEELKQSSSLGRRAKGADAVPGPSKIEDSPEDGIRSGEVPLEVIAMGSPQACLKICENTKCARRCKDSCIVDAKEVANIKLDYCEKYTYGTEPPLTRQKNRYCSLRHQCEECQGECNYDHQCKGTLTCFQRNGSEKVPGCSGASGQDKWDYCHDPDRANNGDAACHPKLGTQVPKKCDAYSTCLHDQ